MPAKQSAAPQIAVERAAGKPRLEVLEGNPAQAPGAKGAPAVEPLPPPSQTAAPPFSEPTAPQQEVRRLWSPEEAALLFTGAHNAAWTPYHLLRKEQALVEARAAEPKELDAAAPALGRLLDRQPLVQPGGEGPLGIFGDLLVATQALVTLELRHQELVEQARRRLARENGSHPQPAARPAPAAGPPPSAPPAPPRHAGPQAASEEQEDEGGFRFTGPALEVLNGNGHSNPLAAGKGGGPFR
jgi:hypothetical protein